MMKSVDASRSGHLVLITLGFVAWKALLGLVAYCSPGIGYDTSSSLLEDFETSLELTETPSTLHYFLTKLIRWDAIYFAQIAARSYVFEQEWAFSYAFSKIIATVSSVMNDRAPPNDLQTLALTGVLLSNLAHLCSVYVLYFLSKGTFVKSDHAKQIALGAALLHIVSPAGMFLSSPYTESLFALLNFSGSALYLRGMSRLYGHATMSQRLQVVTAGCLFGIATTIRSNGLLSGLPFLYDAVARTWAIANHGFSSRRLSDLASLTIGGLLVLSGLVVPQIVAYRMYCTDSMAAPRQPWCSRAVPSIYAWVQEHYWVNGLFRYWTVSNIPLFLLAAPMLFILSYTAFRALWPDSGARHKSGTGPSMKTNKPDEGALVRLALSQLTLAFLALFVYNVQIITRLSSGYPLWYISVAERIVFPVESASQEKSFMRSNVVFRFMIMYAIIQGGLFASFLPPA